MDPLQAAASVVAAAEQKEEVEEELLLMMLLLSPPLSLLELVWPCPSVTVSSAAIAVHAHPQLLCPWNASPSAVPPICPMQINEFKHLFLFFFFGL